MIYMYVERHAVNQVQLFYFTIHAVLRIGMTIELHPFTTTNRDSYAPKNIWNIRIAENITKS